MLKPLVATAVVLAALSLSPRVHSQADKPRSPASTIPGLDGWGRPIVPVAKDQKSAPAPKHDISGVWDAPNGSGTQVLGAAAAPETASRNTSYPILPRGWKR